METGDVPSADAAPAAGDLPVVGLPQRTFTLPADSQPWTVTPDGQRFLVGAVVHQAVPAPIHVPINWLGERGRSAAV